MTQNQYKKIVLSLILLIALGFFLSDVFSGRFILPQIFNLGPFLIHYYGIFMALAVASAFYLALKRASIYNLQTDIAEDLMFWVIVGGFVGARVYHVLTSIQYYYSHPLQAFQVWNGGLSIYGAVIGGFVTLWLYNRLVTRHSSLVTFLDWLTPSLIVGQIIGRFGNLFNYEVLGYPTNLPWKMFVPESFRPLDFLDSQFFHPFFLYEAFGSCLILLFILKIAPKWQKANRPGQLFFFYLLLYNILRFSLEFLRVDSNFIYGIRQNAAVSLFLVVLALGLIIYNGRRVQIS